MIRSTKRFTYSFMNLRDLYWSGVVANSRSYLRELVGDLQSRGDGKLSIKSLGLELEKTPFSSLLISGYDRLNALKQFCGAEFEMAEDHLIVRIGSARHIVENLQHLLILIEIYAHEDYHIVDQGIELIFDIGANVGIASLYFAQKFPTAKVEAFEPMSHNADLLQRNLELNPEIAKRVQLHKCALSDQDGSAEIEFTQLRGGISTMHGSADAFRNRGYDAVETIDVRKASVAIQEGMKRTGVESADVKIDCEGGEYAIIDELIETGVSLKLRSLFGEWHNLDEKRNATELSKTLLKDGFTAFFLNSNNRKVGRFYAIRR